jgi:hypothetical protein
MNVRKATARGNAHSLKLHRIEAFKVSNDKHFVETMEVIVGLYLNPPDHAIVMRVMTAAEKNCA